MGAHSQSHAEAPGDPAVLELQQLLVRHGYLTQAELDTGPGILGPRTRAALALVLDGRLPPDASSDAAPARPPSRLTPRSYRVRKGDTLSRIAVDQGVSVQALMAANDIEDVRLLWVGQVLTLPKADAPSPVHAVPPPASEHAGASPPPAAHASPSPGKTSPVHADEPPRAATPPGPASTGARQRVDFAFISSCEGGQCLKAYVPDAENSQSGVTVATGFDLGCRDVAALQALGLSQGLCTRLARYLGKKKSDAKRLLATSPLTLTQAEADAIDAASKKSALQEIVQSYNRAVARSGKSGLQPFEKLPGEAQTVIASVAFQYGDLSSRTPKFWATVTEQRWKDAVAELRDFGDHYRSRREKEADLLARIVTGKSAPSTTTTPPPPPASKPAEPGTKPSGSSGSSATPQATSGFCFPFSSLPSESWKTGMRVFGANRSGGKRKHAGCDLYFPQGTWIHAVSDGEVIQQPYNFYNGTQAMEIRHGSIIVRYGEIKPNSFVGGHYVKRGQRICQVGHLQHIDVKSDMLHIELYAGTATGPLTVRGRPPYSRRKDLLDPTPYLDLWSKSLPSP